jgi:hypothetical protein
MSIVGKLLIVVRSEFLTAVTMKSAVFWDVAPCRYCVTDVSEERISIFRVEKSASEEPAARRRRHSPLIVNYSF